MAYKEKFNEEDGVWRTIGGRKVFIRNGQNLADAMIESGKFSKKGKMRENYRKAKEEDEKKFDEDLDKSIDRINKNRQEKESKDEENEESHKMNTIKYETKGYVEATDGKYKGKPIVDYREKDFKEGTSVLMPFACGDCGKEFYAKSSIHDFFEQGDFDDPYETAKGLSCPKCKNSDNLEYNGEVLIKEPSSNGKENERNKSTNDSFKDMTTEKAKANLEKAQRESKEQQDRWDNQVKDAKKDYLRKEINGYLDDVKRDGESSFGDRDEFYKYMNKNWYDVDKDEFDKIFDEEESKRNKSTNDKVSNSKKTPINSDTMFEDFGSDMEGISNIYERLGYTDEAIYDKMIEDADNERLVQVEKDGKKYVQLDTGDKLYKYLGRDSANYPIIEKESSDTWKDEVRKKSTKESTPNYSKYSADEQDILDGFGEDYGWDNPNKLQNLKQQIDDMRNPRESIRQTAKEYVQGGGGTSLIYVDDARKYLDERNIKYDKDNPYETYSNIMAEQIEKLYNDASNKSTNDTMNKAIREKATNNNKQRDSLLKQIENETDMYAFNEVKNGNYSNEELNEILQDLKGWNAVERGEKDFREFMEGRKQSTNESMNDTIRKQANIKNEWKQYLKDHPNSKMSLSRFKNMKK